MADDTDTDQSLTDIVGVGPSWADDLEDAGYDTVASIADAAPDDLEADVDGVGETRAQEIIDNATVLVADDGESASDEDDNADDEAVITDDYALDDADEDVVVTDTDALITEGEGDRITITLEIDADLFPYVQHVVLEEALSQFQRNRFELQEEAESIASVLSSAQHLDAGPEYEITLTESQLTTLYRALRQGSSAYGSRSGVPEMYGTLTSLADEVNEYR